MSAPLLHQFDVFAQIIAAGNLATCARDMGLPMEDVVDALDRLENRLGYRLFYRSGASVDLTDAGRTLVSALGRLSVDSAALWDGEGLPLTLPPRPPHADASTGADETTDEDSDAFDDAVDAAPFAAHDAPAPRAPAPAPPPPPAVRPTAFEEEEAPAPRSARLRTGAQLSRKAQPAGPAEPEPEPETETEPQPAPQPSAEPRPHPAFPSARRTPASPNAETRAETGPETSPAEAGRSDPPPAAPAPAPAGGQTIVLASHPAIFTHFQEALVAFEEASPDIGITLRLDALDTESLEALFADRLADIAYFYALEEPEGLASRYAWSERISLFVSRDHPLAERASVLADDLAGAHQVTFAAGNIQRKLAAAALERSGLRLGPAAVETDNLYDLMKQVRAGKGCFAAFGPIARDFGKMPGITRLAYAQGLPQVEVRQAVRPDRAGDAAVVALAEFLFR